MKTMIIGKCPTCLFPIMACDDPEPGTIEAGQLQNDVFRWVMLGLIVSRQERIDPERLRLGHSSKCLNMDAEVIGGSAEVAG